jgi:GNAT superfamily N-acetyltransferase
LNVRSIALTTELALLATRGRITDRGNYLVIETPDDPGYYYGNLLVLAAPPQLGEVAHWLRKFGDELGGNPAIKHVTLCWDAITHDVPAAQELVDHGFTLEKTQLMIADELDAAPAALPIRALTSDEVLATADLAWTIGDRHDDAYRQFLHRRAAWHRDLVVRGLARFYGAFDDGLVASLGLVTIGTLARYQDIQTLTSYRRRGLARALLTTSARAAFAAGSERVALVAIPDSDAARVYTRTGFRVIERNVSACRYPPDVLPWVHA